MDSVRYACRRYMEIEGIESSMAGRKAMSQKKKKKTTVHISTRNERNGTERNEENVKWILGKKIFMSPFNKMCVVRLNKVIVVVIVVVVWSFHFACVSFLLLFVWDNLAFSSPQPCVRLHSLTATLHIVLTCKQPHFFLHHSKDNELIDTKDIVSIALSTIEMFEM